jgi:hypothetical protein
MRSLITGATGFVGRRLLKELSARGPKEPPIVLSRDRQRAERDLSAYGVRALRWNLLTELAPAEALAGVDAVFHLAGESVAEGRWTSAKKIRLRDSRIVGTRNLVAALAQAAQKPQVLVSASAIGYYGDRGEELLEESSPPQSDFLGELCQAWEREALAAEALGIRVVTIRIGIVLGEGGGALARMLTPFYLGLGAPLGSGNQWMSWIHVGDLARLMVFAAEHEQLRGAVNGVAPSPVTNRQFTKVLGKVLSRPTIFPPVPGFMLRLMFGEFGQILLHSQRVQPKAALAAGFAFQFPELEPALRDILKKQGCP